MYIPKNQPGKIQQLMSRGRESASFKLVCDFFTVYFLRGKMKCQYCLRTVIDKI